MRKSTIALGISGLALGTILLSGCQPTKSVDSNASMSADQVQNETMPASADANVQVGVSIADGDNMITGIRPDQIVDLSSSPAPIKEVTMTSFANTKDGKPAPEFSVKEITVKKGDQIKINVTVTKGTHNFNIDEYNISQDTPLNQPVTIQFTADKTGRFIYYCSMPGHRALGHWGVLNVVE